jgi:hypothetical protein
VVRGGWGGKEIPTGFWLCHLKERPLGRGSRRWKDNIKVDVHGIRWKGCVLN